MSKPYRNIFAVILTLVLSSLFAAAQSAPVITNNTEYDIGVECPTAQALAPDATVLWVLFLNCAARGGSTLTAYTVADGSIAAAPLSVLADDTMRGRTIDRFTNPMALTADGDLSIRAIDSETYAPISLLISPDGSDVPSPVIDDAALNELLLTATDFPELAIYSPDHTRTAVTGSTALTVFDLTTGETLLSMPVEEETYNAYPSFSPDGQILYVAVLDDYENMEAYDVTVSAYSLIDGSMTGSFAAPSFLVWVSPDGKYAAVERGSNDGTSSELMVVDTESGAVSASYSLYEPARRLTTCTNSGRNMSDVDFTVSGRLSLVGLNWLPDSSGFVFTRSYGGEGAGGASVCTFNTSRMNVIGVSGGS